MARLPAAQRREQLLDVAAQLFATRGYAGATTAQIAKEADVTEPIIYRHFKSKRDLFVALIERIGKQTLEQWESDLGKSENPAIRLARLLGENPMVSGEGRVAAPLGLALPTLFVLPDLPGGSTVDRGELDLGGAQVMRRGASSFLAEPQLPAIVAEWASALPRSE